MTSDKITLDLQQFCDHIFSPLGAVTVQWHDIQKRPLKLRVGVKVHAAAEDPDAPVVAVTPEVVQSAFLPETVTAAWKKAWPVNMWGGYVKNSLATSGDNETVIFDLVFYSVELDPPAHLMAA